MFCTTDGVIDALKTCDGNFQKVIDAINESAPAGLKGDDRYIGNSIYMAMIDYANDDSIERSKRERAQEFLFDNYRVNGILDVATTTTDI